MSLPLIHVRLLDRVLVSMLLHLLHLAQLSLHIVDHLVILRFDLVQFEDCTGNLRRNRIACHVGHFTVLDLILVHIGCLLVVDDGAFFNFLQAFDNIVELMVDLANFGSKLVLAALH